MHTVTRIAVLLVLLVLILGAAAAGAETIACTAITSVPFTITVAGIYCLTQDISTNLASGNAIEIAANNVVVDLNDHKLGNLAAGPGTMARGIHALNRQNITIKNGTVRGFEHGIFLENTGASQAHIVESIRADLNTHTAIQVEGTGHIIRNNLVVGTGGTTAFGTNPSGDGILVYGSDTRIINNDVNNTIAMGLGSANAIHVQSSSTVVENNRVSNGALTPSAFTAWIGIRVISVPDVLVVDNRIAKMGWGVLYEFGGTGKYGRNLTSGVTMPFTGGTDAGGNN